VNILPRLTAMAPQDEFRVLVRSERLGRSIEASPNLEVDLLPRFRRSSACASPTASCRAS
jgi:hypothetical protein